MESSFRDQREIVRELLILYVDRYELMLAKGYRSCLKPRPEGGATERRSEVDDLKLWLCDLGKAISLAMTDRQRDIMFARLVTKPIDSGKRGIPWPEIVRRFGVSQVEAKRQLRASIERLAAVLKSKGISVDYKNYGRDR